MYNILSELISIPTALANIPTGGNNNVGYTGLIQAGKEASADGNFLDIVMNAINFALWIIGPLALIFLIYGGFLYLTSAGDDTKVKTGTNIIKYTVIGIIVIMLSYSLTRFVIDSVQNLDPEAANLINNSSGFSSNTNSFGGRTDTIWCGEDSTCEISLGTDYRCHKALGGKGWCVEK